jgi:rhodanese-related sulfurtransferase
LKDSSRGVPPAGSLNKGDVMQPQELAERMDSKNPPTVVDVRTGFEFRKGHIPGAIHAPTWKILLRLAHIPADKKAELVLTCELGPRALIAMGLLKAFGYRNMVLLVGQMAGWRKDGYPQEK